MKTIKIITIFLAFILLSAITVISTTTITDTSINVDNINSDVSTVIKVNGNVNITGDLNITGTFFGDQVYGEMWNYSSNSSAWTFPIASSGIYYNLTGLVAGDLSGFTYTGNDQPQGGSYFTAEHSGRYKVNFGFSFASMAIGGVYGIAVVHDFDVGTHRECYARRQGTTSVGNLGITCIIDVTKGDNINIQIEDESNPAKDILVHTANLNLVRVGK